MNDPGSLEIVDQSAPVELPAGEQDLRGHGVVDAEGEEIGSVEALYVDTLVGTVRFFVVTAGESREAGDAWYVIPVDAIDHVADRQVRLGHPRSHLEEAPRYRHPAADRAYWDAVYRSYGYIPFWSP